MTKSRTKKHERDTQPSGTIENARKAPSRGQWGWQETLTVIIAVVGGVPGALAIEQWIHRRPDLYVFHDGTILSSIRNTQTGQTAVGITLMLTLSNRGQEDFSPKNMNMDYEGPDGSWVTLTTAPIPSGTTFAESPDQVISTSEPWKMDLFGRSAPIHHGSAVYGFLMGGTDQISRAQVAVRDSYRVRLRIADVYNKEDSHVFTVHNRSRTPGALQQHGIFVVPREDDSTTSWELEPPAGK